jgi:hypothetical protein
MTDSRNSGLTAMGRRMLSKAAIQLESLCLSRRSAPWRVSRFGGYEEEMLERALSSASPTMAVSRSIRQCTDSSPAGEWQASCFGV